MKDTEREADISRGRSRLHAGDVGLDPRTPGSHPEPKADTQPLSHPGIAESLFKLENTLFKISESGPQTGMYGHKAMCTAQPLAFFLLELFYVHMQGLLDGVPGDEADKVLDVCVALLEQTVGCGLAHQVLGQLPGVVYRKVPVSESPPRGWHHSPPS